MRLSIGVIMTKIKAFMFPYTMTVSDSDHYTFSLGSALEADTEVTVETTGSAYRAIIFGIQVK